MRRLPRRLFTLCSAASLLLCVAACALWLRSHYLTDEIVLRRINGFAAIRTAKGQVVLRLKQVDPVLYSEPTERRGWQHETWEVLPREDDHLRPFRPSLGGYAHYGGRTFFWEHERQPSTNLRTARAIFPYWSVALLTAALPLCWAAARTLSRAAAEQRERRGHCATCGYDRRASPERCPECGAAATAKEAA